MKRFFALTLSLFVALAWSISLHAKSPTTRITISGPGLSATINITDKQVVSKFEVWAGPGVTRGDGVASEVEEAEGFIIDWHAGVVERPSGLPRYQVAFYGNSPDQPVYVVSYEPDASKGRGYVYLPGKGDDFYPVNIGTISHGHGFEGHWLRAANDWQDVAATLIARATR